MGKVARGEDFILVDDGFEREAIPRSLCDRCGVEVHNALAASLYDGHKVIGALIFVNCDVLSEKYELNDEMTSPFDSLTSPDILWLENLATPGGSFMILLKFNYYKLQRKRLREVRFVSLIARQLGRGISVVIDRKVEPQQERLMSIGRC